MHDTRPKRTQLQQWCPLARETRPKKLPRQTRGGRGMGTQARPKKAKLAITGARLEKDGDASKTQKGLTYHYWREAGDGDASKTQKEIGTQARPKKALCQGLPIRDICRILSKTLREFH